MSVQAFLLLELGLRKVSFEEEKVVSGVRKVAPSVEPLDSFSALSDRIFRPAGTNHIPAHCRVYIARLWNFCPEIAQHCRHAEQMYSALHIGIPV